jgi:hypothetical protein
MLALLHTSGATAETAASAVPAPSGSIGIQLLQAPVSLEDNPRAHQYIIDYLAPGTVISREIEIDNTSDALQHIDLYAAAATIGGGTFNFAPDQTANELTGWIGVSPASHDLPAHSDATVEATITVPKSASAGERYAVIWAQDTSAPIPGASVRQVNRVGVRVYLDIGLGGEPISNFQSKDWIGARAADGRPEVLADVQNTGARALDMSGNLWLTNGPGSLSAGPFAADLGTTLGIGQTERVTVPLDKQLPDGPWTVRLTLISGVTQQTVTATLSFPQGVGANPPVKPNQPGSGFGLVLKLAGGAALALLLVLLIYLWGRRRADRAGTPPW